MRRSITTPTTRPHLFRIVEDRGFAYAMRLLLASPFIVSGVVKATHFSGTIVETESLGLYPGTFFAIATVVTQLGGSLLFLSQRYCAVGALLLALFTMSATVLAHAFWLYPGAARGMQMAIFFEHAAIVGGLVTAAIVSRRDAPA